MTGDAPYDNCWFYPYWQTPTPLPVTTTNGTAPLQDAVIADLLRRVSDLETELATLRANRPA